MTFSGIIFPIILFILGIFVTRHYTKIYPRHMTFYANRVINLYRNLSDLNSKLKIFYKDEVIDNNIILMSGFLVCDGNQDISNNSDPIILNLPEGYKWLELKAMSHYKELNNELSYSIKDNKAELKFARFKCDESIYIHSIIESKEREFAPDEKISFVLRMDNIKKTIKIKENPVVSQNQFTIGKTITILIVFIALLFLIAAYYLFKSLTAHPGLWPIALSLFLLSILFINEVCRSWRIKNLIEIFYNK